MRILWLLVVLIIFINVVFADSPHSPFQREEAVFNHFTNYISNFKKVYQNEQEKAQRFLFFKENMKKAAVLNELHNGTATFGATIFSDLSAEEFASKYLMRATDRQACHEVTERNHTLSLLGFPKTLDWAHQGKVTPVGNQGNCGSCWAFAAIGEIESQLIIKNRGSYSLSKEQLLDCDTSNWACGGGFIELAYKYIRQKGLMSEADYSYLGKPGPCKYNPAKLVPAATLKSSTSFWAGVGIAQVYNFIATHGPAVAHLDATPLQNYINGIINLAEKFCPNMNHAVLIVGYDSNDGPSFYRAKNSWGTSFGEQGFFRITPQSCLMSTCVIGSDVT